MKRGIIAGLALIVAFAIIGCPEPEKKKPAALKNPITVTFNYNDTRTGADAVYKTVKIEKGTALGKNMPKDPAAVLDGKEFAGWYKTASNQLDLVLGTDPLSADITVYAAWENIGKRTVVFYPNFAGATENPVTKEATKGASLASGDVASFTRTDWVLDGWNTKADGSGTTVVPTTYKFDYKMALYAKWKLDLTGYVEEVKLANAWYVVYQFTLPDGKAFTDYSGVTAQYLFNEEDLEDANARGMRLQGNQKVSHFTFVETSVPNQGGAKAVVPYGGHNDILVNNRGSGWGGSDSLAAALATLAEFSDGVEADTWFTMKYDFPDPLTSSLGNWSAAENAPTATDKVLYFGVGLPGQGNGGNVHLIRKVMLVGKTGTTDLQGLPAVFEVGTGASAVQYPAFTGYPNIDSNGEGTDGYAESYRKSIGTLTATTIPHQFSIFEVTFNYNWPAGVPGTQPADVKKNTGRNGKLAEADLAAPPAAAVPSADYKFKQWATTEAGGTKVTTSTDFTVPASRTIYAEWEDACQCWVPGKNCICIFDCVCETCDCGTYKLLKASAGDLSDGAYEFGGDSDVTGTYGLDEAITFLRTEYGSRIAFDFTDLVEDDTIFCKYTTMKVTLSVVRAPAAEQIENAGNDMKLTFHQGRKLGVYSGGAADYNDCASDGTYVWEGRLATFAAQNSGAGIYALSIQHNDGGSLTSAQNTKFDIKIIDVEFTNATWAEGVNKRFAKQTP